MDNYLAEMFAIFDKTEVKYNSSKPIKFNLETDNIDELFDKKIVSKGQKLENSVPFLEKINGRYLAIVEDQGFHCVIVDKVVKDFHNMWCSCNKPYLDEHIYATLQNIRNKKIKMFYKKNRKKDEKNILESVRLGKYYLAFGIADQDLLVVSQNGTMSKMPIKENGKVVFEVIEDDDNLSLSKMLEDFDK